MQKRILFVDDEPMILAGLRRSLRPMRTTWAMEFAGGGQEALEWMARAPFDVVVTDMRMPGMDGVQLLREVEKRYPRCLRIVLSGQSEQEAILRMVNLAHQYVSKPCDTEEIRLKLTRAFALDELLEDGKLKELISRLESVPSLPFLYFEIVKELEADEPSIAKVATTISGDMGMATKVLQLVNSAFFAMRQNVSNLTQAVSLLGIETIKALVLSAHVFSQFDQHLLKDLDLRWLWEHSFVTAGYAKAITKCEGGDARAMENSFTAGLLHDTGTLVLASSMPKQYNRMLQVGADEALPRVEAERNVFGCSHAAVGAYLFALWGLPTAVVEAVAWHHFPGESPVETFCPLAAVHIASVLSHRTDPLRREPDALDEAFLAKLGLADREPKWLEACQWLARVS